MGQVKDYKYIKKTNKKMVFQHIFKKAPISRAELSRVTTMSPTTITRIVKELMEEGYVQEKEAAVNHNQVGRRAITLDIVHDSVITIGVFIDKDVQKIGILELNNQLIASQELRLSTDEPDTFLENLCIKINEMIITFNIKRDNMIGIGVGIPGIVDNKKGIVNFSAILGWYDVAITEKMEVELGIKTVIDNEIKTRALAAYQTSELYVTERIAFINFDSEVNAVFIINDEIYRGSSNSAGEIGHMTINIDGEKCECGKRGCLQMYLMTEALIKQAQKYDAITSLEDIFKYYRTGEKWALKLIDQAIKYIYVTISNVVCMYNPDMVIIDGILINKMRQNKINLLAEGKNDYVWQPLENTFRTSYSLLERQDVSIGAAILAQNFLLNWSDVK